jgi:hypothetical protein
MNGVFHEMRIAADGTIPLRNSLPTGGIMKNKTLGVAIVALLVLAVALPAVAAAPGEGTVFEGVSVPGLALGDTRATADSSFGEPDQCRDYVWSDQTVEYDNECRYPAEGGGTVTVRFDRPRQQRGEQHRQGEVATNETCLRRLLAESVDIQGPSPTNARAPEKQAPARGGTELPSPPGCDRP